MTHREHIGAIRRRRLSAGEERHDVTNEDDGGVGEQHVEAAGDEGEGRKVALHAHLPYPSLQARRVPSIDVVAVVERRNIARAHVSVRERV